MSKLSHSNDEFMIEIDRLAAIENGDEDLIPKEYADTRLSETGQPPRAVFSDPQSDDVRRQTIEECARVAENLNKKHRTSVGFQIVEAIRALQPQPNGGKP